MRTSASTDTLNKLVNTAININVKLYELRQELRDDPRARVTTTRPPLTFNQNPWKNGAARQSDQRGN
jgi:hypothetical protein